jgi:hypothetical protein
MAVSRSLSRKAPSQAPKDFFACEQSGGTHGGTGKAPEKSTSGPMREKIFGLKALKK